MGMKRPSFAARLRYAFDNTVSKGPMSLIGWLALASAGLILLATLAVVAANIVPAMSPLAVLWTFLLQALAPNPVEVSAGPWPFLLAMLFITLGSIFMVSILIGILTTSIEERILALRKGRSQVLENGHTVILGWSELIFTIISELAIANANQKKPCIAILADKDKVEMEDEIRAKVGDTGRTRVVCRSGSPIESNDLDIVSLSTCRSIIVLAQDGEDPDSNVIKTILAITNSPQRRPEPHHIVAEIHDPKTVPVARMISETEVELILGGDVIARIIAQTCRQSGLSVVYTELLDFEGDEIYFQAEPALVGKTFGEALLAYEDSAVLGLCPRGGKPKLNPPMDTIIQDGDQIIAISEDDDTVRLSGLTDWGIREEAILPARPTEHGPERTLILGWNWRAPTVINELAAYVAPGSEVMVVADYPQAATEIARLCPSSPNQRVTFQQGDTTDRRVLDALDIPSFQHVIILCYSDLLDPQRADARTLISLLHLRDIAERAGHTFSIVSEMLDVRNRDLAEVTRADDFVVSDKLISLMLAQVSENRALNAVFEDLFDPEGSEIYLKPAGDYVRLGESLNFYTVVEAARRRGEVAFGYRLKAKANDATSAYGVVVNPDKSKPIAFAPGDTIIMLAES
jgi:voltage-gated potassium channel Kch